MRAVGVSRLLQELAGPLAIFFALVTQLGDVWLLTLVVALVYWLDVYTPNVGSGIDRDRTALVVALLVGALALSVGLKSLFAAARPPGFDVAAGVALLPPAIRASYAALATASGYGFPSGHAIGASIVWGALAWAVRVGPVRTRVALATGVITAVALSRLVLGVHYLVDVLAGLAVGLAYLALVIRWCETPLRGFLAALAVAMAGTVLAATGVAAAPLTTDHAAVLGLAVGTTLAWYAVGDALPVAPSRKGALVTVALGALLAGPVLVFGAAHESLAVAGTASAAGAVLMVAMPLAGERVAAAVGESADDPTRS